MEHLSQTKSPHRNRTRSGLAQELRELGFTASICVVIALLIWLPGGSPSFFSAFAFSLPIGLSTHLYTRVAMQWFPNAHVGLIWLVTVPGGVATGILIGGIVLGIPVMDLFDDSAPVGSLVIALVATYVFYSYYSMNEMRAHIREQELIQLRSEKRIVETQMRLLQSQIEPHFLFNTLSNVLSLVRADPDRAETMLQQLTQFLRASLQHSRADRASLRDELDLLESYLSIIKIRMGDRLEYSLHVDVDADDIALSPLILQPLVENAVRHGLEPKVEGGRVDVEVAAEGESLVIRVADTGVGLSDNSGGSGFGLSNIRSRLDMLYGKQATLEFADVDPHGLSVTIRIPLRQ